MSKLRETCLQVLTDSSTNQCWSFTKHWLEAKRPFTHYTFYMKLCNINLRFLDCTRLPVILGRLHYNNTSLRPYLPHLFLPPSPPPPPPPPSPPPPPPPPSPSPPSPSPSTPPAKENSVSKNWSLKDKVTRSSLNMASVLKLSVIFVFMETLQRSMT